MPSQCISFNTHRSGNNYYEGDVTISAPRVYYRPAKSCYLTLALGSSYAEAGMAFYGVLDGNLGSVLFKKAETLDMLCARWLVFRGLIDDCDLSTELYQKLKEDENKSL